MDAGRSTVNPSTGALSGTPLEARTVDLPVQVRDSSDNAVAGAILRVEIAPELRVAALGTIRVHSEASYSTPVPSVTGKRGTLAWSIAEGTLPDWARLDSATGVISGTAPASGANSGPLKLVATDSADQVSSGPASIALEVVGALGVANLPTHFSARNGSLFTSARPTAVNALGAVTWSWGAGSVPPAWVTLDATTGILSGTPVTIGETQGLSLIVTDGTGKTASSAPFVLTVFSQPSVTVAQVAPKGRIGSSISIAPNVNGLSGSPSWSLVPQPGSDGLPTGLTLDPATGIVSGTPTQAGSAFFTIRVTDGDDLAIADSPTISLVVGPTLSLGGMAGAYYGRVGSFVALDLPTLQGQVGATVSYGISLETGTMPSGLSIADTATGHIRGVPTGSLLPTIATLTVTDSFDNKTASTNFTLGIRPAPAISGLADVSLRNDEDVAATALPVNAANLFYPAAAYWSISGQLPNGVSLNSSTGRLTGKPTGYATATTFPNLTLTLTDQTDNRSVTSAPFSITVNSGVALATSQPSYTARGGTNFVAAAPTATGLAGTATWSLTTVSGVARPYSIATNGAVTVSPQSTATGTWVYDLTVTDSVDRRTASTRVSATFQRATIVSYAANTAVAPDQAVSIAPSVAYNLGALRFELASGGPLPTGITLDPANGVISGSSATPATSTVTVRAIDTDGYAAVSSPIRIAVSNAPDVYLGTYSPPKVRKAFSLAASTNVSGVTWSITGALPSGLTFASGAITGTPTVPGNFGPFTINAKNTTTSITGSSESFSLTVLPGIDLAVASAAAKWRVGLPAQTTFSITNAVGNTSWTIASGRLPDGLTMDSSTGRIQGTPTQFGSFSINVLATDSEGATATLTHALTVDVGPALAYSMPLMRPNMATSVLPQVQYLLGTPSYAIVSGSLPNGLSFDTSTGRIWGTPTVATPSAVPLTIRLTDVDGAFIAKTVNILVSENDFVIDAGGTTFTATVDEPFSLAPIAYVQSQASNQYVSWSIQGLLPNGLSFDPILGTISGTPTYLGIGTKTFSIAALYGQRTANSPTLTLTVSDRAALVVTFPQADLTVARGNAVSLQPSVSNAVGQVTWALDSGRLPNGLSISDRTGLISGTATTNGSFQFVLRATDAGAKTALSPSFTAVVQDGIAVSVTEVSSTPRAGKVYLANANATGASGTVSWSVLQGPLPPGIVLEQATGRITGTPSSAGTWTYYYRATDSQGAFKDGSHTIVVAPGPSVGAVPFLSTNVGKPFSYTPVATSTSGATTWSVTGTLPAGISLTNAATGTISGTPSASGVANGLRMTVVDADGLTSSSATFSIGVSPDTVALGINVSPNYALQQGQPTSIVPSVTGATAATQTYTIDNLYGGSWSTNVPSRLPTGMGFDSATGIISGTPATSTLVYSTFRITVTDNRSPTKVTATSNQIVLSLTPLAPMEVTNSPSFQMNQGQPFVFAPTVRNAIGTVTFALQYNNGSSWNSCSAACSGTLPSGLTFDTTTGKISGTPSTTSVAFPAWRIMATDGRPSTTYSNPFVLSTTPWKDPTIALPSAETLPRGQPVTIAPTITDTIGTVTFALQYNNRSSWNSCSAACSSTLPSGMTFDTTTGKISGTPSTASVAFPAWRILMTETRMGQTINAYSNPMVLLAADWVAPTLSMDSTLSLTRGVAAAYAPTPQGVSGTLGPFALQYNNGVSWYPCAGACSGTLPLGLSFDTTTGKVSGTPLATSSPYIFRTTVTETRLGNALNLISNIFTITISEWPLPTVSYPELVNYTLGVPVEVVPTIANVSGSFTYSLRYTNGSSWYSCSNSTCSGMMPTGLSFDSVTGKIQGTPTAGTGAYGFQLSLTETRMGQVNQATAKALMLAPTPAAGPTLTYGVANVVAATPSGGFDVLPTLSAGATRTGNFTISYQNARHPSSSGDWNANSLPAGASFDASTGRLSAATLAPAAAGNWRGYRICVPTTAGTACALDVTIAIAPRPNVEIEMQSYIDVVQRRSVSVSPTAVRNAVGAVTFALGQSLIGSQTGEYNSASPPPGMSFDSATGTIYGSPTTAGTWRGYRVYAQDSQGSTYRGVSPEIVIRVTPMDGLKVTVPDVVDLRQGDSVDLSATATGAFGTVTWNALQTQVYGVGGNGDYVSASLPTGLSYANGRISGTLPQTIAVGNWRGYRICGRDEASRTACSDEIIFRVSAIPPLEIATPDIVYVRPGEALSLVPTSRNAQGSLVWNALQTQVYGVGGNGDYVSASLPTGLSYSTVDGSISGTVGLTTAVGRYRGYRVAARDSRNVTAYSKEIVIEVQAIPTLSISVPMMVDVDRGGTVSIVPTLGNVIGTPVWNSTLSVQNVGAIQGNGDYVSASLPTGLSYSAVDGSISGTVGAKVVVGRYRGYRILARDARNVAITSDEIIINVR